MQKRSLPFPLLFAVLLLGGLSTASTTVLPTPPPTESIASFVPRLSTLEKSSTDEEAERALAELLYNQITYPAANRNGGVEGKSSLTLIIGSNGKVQSYSTGADNQPKAKQAEELGDLELVIIGYRGKRTPKSKANIGLFSEEAKKMLELIKEVGFHPPFLYGFDAPIEYTIYFKFQLEK